MEEIEKKRKVDRKFESEEDRMFQLCMSHMAPRQKAIELAKVVDLDCEQLGLDRYPHYVGSWNDDRRVPFYWLDSSDSRQNVVLTFDCQQLYVGDCQQTPTSLSVDSYLLRNAYDLYDHFEHKDSTHMNILGTFTLLLLNNAATSVMELR
ncbi:MAG: hypothetical protein ACKPKO_37160 [Candidatus Fonsibacter sp.]